MVKSVDNSHWKTRKTVDKSINIHKRQKTYRSIKISYTKNLKK